MTRKFELLDKVRLKRWSQDPCSYSKMIGTVVRYDFEIDPETYGKIWLPYIEWTPKSIIYTDGLYIEDALELIERVQNKLL